MNKTINVVDEFHPRPKWRYRHEGDGSGQEFREDVLRQALKDFDSVHVDLSGYNRYGPSFISEAFGGLIRDEGFSLAYLKQHLTIEHKQLPSIPELCWIELEEAATE
ncbi:STAS-like domain-containing protein [Vibrio parahaemolyticus]|nr:STAS-like domain-containing protein [Vibrio parahaemolyticus]